MPSQNCLTVVFPEGIGPVSRFKNASRSFVKIKPGNGSLAEGSLLLQLSLKELGEIRRLSKQLNNPNPELFRDAKSQYDVCLAELARLEQASESTSIVNVLRRREIRRNKQALVADVCDLYVTIKSTSERMQRAMLSRDSLVEQVQAESIPSDATYRGYAIDATDEDIREAVSEDPSVNLAPDQIPSRPNVNVKVCIGCIIADNSNLNNVVLNSGE